MLHELAALLGNRIRHDDLYSIALYRAAQCKADALIAAGWFDDNGIGTDQTAALGVLHHIQCRAGFNGAADIQAFKFDKHLGAVCRDHAAQTHHRRMADCFQDVAAYH